MKKTIRTAAVCVILLILTLVSSCAAARPENTGGAGTAEEKTETKTSEKPAHEHSFGDWVTVKESTCAEAGARERRCECGKTESETIPAKAHTVVSDEAREPDCTTEGRTEGSHCSVCGKVIKGYTIAALGHNYVKGVCTRCGDTKTQQKGDIFTFGRYEQDNAPDNGREPIEWIILEIENGKALLLSRYALDGVTYNDSYSAVTWATCSLRPWLNETFYGEAFNDEEKARILPTTLTNENNPKYRTVGGIDTTDNLFLLSYDDVNNTEYGFAADYDDYDAARRCQPTAYARAQGCYVERTGVYAGYCCWWLRTPGWSSKYAASVDQNGYVSDYGRYVCYDSSQEDAEDCFSYGVRPALWIEL